MDRDMEMRKACSLAFSSSEYWPVKNSCSKDDSGGDVEVHVCKNEDLPDKVGVNSMVDKLRKARLRWFGHVKWRYTEAPMTVNRAIKMANHDKDKKLNIMRGFFFWLEHLTRQDAFQPWEDAECLQTMPGSS
ncbi:hypothetical protein H5410_023247 [Solanum commersonii]|uniref:Uncharacterized protein n=1 Tax=Solanum commersonii TaxID=4109 RepID=A0A9J5ZJZ8_SOLCO|nr:hypothetical protein H5410_023247 [Solanum commersonii]